MNPEWASFAPQLSSENCQAASERTEDYNCLAFAAGETDCWWEPYVIPPSRPGIYWPPGVEPDNTIAAWSAALATKGFAPCADPSFEPALLKVALYEKAEQAVHAARQLKSGRWVSKLGDREDIIHDTPDCVGGGDYGRPMCFLARPRDTADP